MKKICKDGIQEMVLEERCFSSCRKMCTTHPPPPATQSIPRQEVHPADLQETEISPCPVMVICAPRHPVAEGHRGLGNWMFWSSQQLYRDDIFWRRVYHGHGSEVISASGFLGDQLGSATEGLQADASSVQVAITSRARLGLSSAGPCA